MQNKSLASGVRGYWAKLYRKKLGSGVRKKSGTEKKKETPSGGPRRTGRGGEWTVPRNQQNERRGCTGRNWVRRKNGSAVGNRQRGDKSFAEG